MPCLHVHMLFLHGCRCCALALRAAGGEALKLSVYRPRARSQQRAAPILVYVPGDGWVGGSHRDRSADLRIFADQGYPVFNVGRLRPGLDRGHAPELNGDPGRIAMIGDSAGGNLVVNSAYMAATGTLPSACAPSPSPRIRAVVALVPAPVYEGTGHQSVSGHRSGGGVDAPPLYRRYAATVSVVRTLHLGLGSTQPAAGR